MIDTFDDLFRQVGEEEGIEPWLLKAIAIKESSLIPYSYRFGRGERRFYKRRIEGRADWTAHRYYDRPEIIAASWGLMQLLYTTAILVGFPREGDPWELMDNYLENIRYGARWFRMKLRICHHVAPALAAYNAGSANYRDDGTFQNQWYVDKVLAYAEQCRERMQAA